MLCLISAVHQSNLIICVCVYICLYIYVRIHSYVFMGCVYGASQVALVVKNPPANAGDIRNSGSILGSGRSPGGGNGNSFQNPCLENSIDRGAWGAAEPGVAELDATEVLSTPLYA